MRTAAALLAALLAVLVPAGCSQQSGPGTPEPRRDPSASTSSR